MTRVIRTFHPNERIVDRPRDFRVAMPREAQIIAVISAGSPWWPGIVALFHPEAPTVPRSFVFVEAGKEIADYEPWWRWVGTDGHHHLFDLGDGT